MPDQISIAGRLFRYADNGSGQSRYRYCSIKSGFSSMQTSMGSSSGSSGLADLYRIQMEAGELENNIALLKNQQNSIMHSLTAILTDLLITGLYILKI